MSDDTNKNQRPKPPAVPSGAEIYSMIMAKIEPELLEENIPGIDKKYSTETPEQKKERGKRYAAAFKEYEKQFTEFIANLKAESKRYRRELFAYIERQSEIQNSSLASLESQFTTP